MGKLNADVVPPTAAPVLPSTDMPSERPKRVRNPSRAVRDILSGAAADRNPPRGVQLPTKSVVEGEHSPSDDERAEVELNLAPGDDEYVAALTEYALAAVVSEAEALEPRTLK